MSETMVDHVAKAILKRHPPWNWEMANEATRQYYRELARAAIEALRSPSEAMVRCGVRSAPLIAAVWYDDARETRQVLKIWEAMIDGALSRPDHEDMSHAKATRLDSAHRESMSAFRSEADKLFDLIYRLSDALTDEGPAWSHEGCEDLRYDVAAALPKSKVPEWLARYSHGKAATN